MNASAAKSGAEGSPPNDAGRKRAALRWQIAGSILLALLALVIAVWWFVAGQYRESTENAYVDGNVVSVTAQVNGVITAINADNTDYVIAGSPLVKLDDTDAKLALARAEAQLAKIVRQVRTQYAAVEQARANQRLRNIELARVKADLAHRKELVGDGAVSGEEARHAEDTVRAAGAALDVSNHQLAASTAQVDRTTIATHPDVLAAASHVRDAYVVAYRTQVPAPVTGVVTKRSAQVGQKISPGVALMSVVPLDNLWVNANFKESQLRHIRIGQPVHLYADVYGNDVVYQGTVIGQDAGTGNAFSLLPAQNATGNWIKVVQRVPVRIMLNLQQVAKYPLQLGLSMKVVVDTRQRDGTRLVVPGTRAHRYQTDVFEKEMARADDIVKQIVQANQ
jgi:membrane fusion protein (multidrug efflux system)